MLHVSEGTNKLPYTTKILKIIQRRSQVNLTDTEVEESGVKKKGTVESKMRVSVEKLDPPILRPKKKACILGEYLSFISFHYSYNVKIFRVLKILFIVLLFNTKYIFNPFSAKQIFSREKKFFNKFYRYFYAREKSFFFF